MGRGEGGPGRAWAMTCQLGFPLARSPNAFVNSLRAATKGLASSGAGGGVPAPSAPGEPPRPASMNRGRHMATRSPMRRIRRSAQGTECMRDAEARVPGDPVGDDTRYPHGHDHEDDRPAHHLEQRAGGAEEGAGLDQRDPTLGDLAPQAHDQVEEEDLDPDAEGVGDQVLCEGRRPSDRREPEERSEEHTSELQSHLNLVCRLLLEKKKKTSPDNSDRTEDSPG